MNKPKLIISSAYAAIITIIFIVAITIFAELSMPLKDWLKNFSGHHWTSKSIFSVLLYAAVTTMLYISLPKHSDNNLKITIGFLLVLTVLAVIIIALFFTAHHFQLL